MKSRLFLVLAALIPAGKLLASADLVPTKVTFQEVLVDDVSNEKALRVRAFVRNIGQQPVQGIQGGLLVGNFWKLGSVYGPGVGGSFNLGAPIQPGATGFMTFSVTVGSLRNCQRVKVIIDTARKLQQGGAEVFRNDTGLFRIRDVMSTSACVNAPIVD